MEEVLDNDLNSIGSNAPIVTKDKAIFNFSKLSQTELTAKFGSFLGNKGYKLEEGEPHDGKYGKGSRIGRILLGAFIKRFAWRVTISPNEGMTELILFKEAKGYVGGAIGVSQVNKEFKSIVNSLTQFHLTQETE